jgi:hypothetical protein
MLSYVNDGPTNKQKVSIPELLVFGSHSLKKKKTKQTSCFETNAYLLIIDGAFKIKEEKRSREKHLSGVDEATLMP